MIYEALAKTDPRTLVSVDAPPGQDQFHGSPRTDQTRQPDAATIDQRHTPTAAKHAHISVPGHNAEIAPERQLHPAGHSSTVDRGDHRLAELEPGRTHGAERRRAIIDPEMQLAQPWISASGDGAEIKAGAKRLSGAGQDPYTRIRV